MKTDQLRI